MRQLLQKSGTIIIYGAAMALMVFILKWLQWKYIIADHSSEIYVGMIALLFTGLGIWVAMQLTHRKVETIIIEKEVRPSNGPIDENELKKLNLTTREYEVLQLLSKGHTNAEIAEKLFLSLSTVKTHASNLFSKMEVKNRTQALEKANRLRIV